ncbi:hypothetical protein [Endozoicomonas acroporae]|uniref:hypothetical protein n=1 Tax=Endozoicomonas acroporae TaxID=1701104 RepID=UPI003D79148B
MRRVYLILFKIHHRQKHFDKILPLELVIINELSCRQPAVNPVLKIITAHMGGQFYLKIPSQFMKAMLFLSKPVSPTV